MTPIKTTVEKAADLGDLLSMDEMETASGASEEIPTKAESIADVVAKVTAEKLARKEGMVKKAGTTVVLNDYYRVNAGTYNILKRNVEKNVPFLLLGPTGVGKTELVDCLAKSMELPLTIFDMGTMTDPIMSLVGTHVIKMKEGITSSKFVASRFSEVIQQPGIVLLDELSRSSAQANNLLFPVLDFRRTLSMEYSFDDSTPIKVHPQCVFAATANLGSQYTGAHKLDRALIDRFMMVEVDPLAKVDLIEIVKYHYPTVSLTHREKIVNTFIKINEAHEKFLISFNLSVRHLKMIAAMVQDRFTIYDSFYAICKGIGSKEGLKALESILNTTV